MGPGAAAVERRGGEEPLASGAPELFVSSGERAGTVFVLDGDSTVLGRSSRCDVVLPDAWISSRHGRVERRGGAWWVVDLGSRNGTYLDGRPVREAALREGARISFGETDAVFRHAEGDGGTLAVRRTATAIRPLSDAAEIAAGRAPPTSAEGARRQLQVLHAIGAALVDASSLEECLPVLLRAIATAVGAERSALLLADGQGAMVPRAFEPRAAPPRFSTAVVSAAVRSRAGLLVMDAQRDERFHGRESIVLAGIRSCLCVPIWAENRILGALVLDRAVVRPFSPDDLDLVTVAAHQAALAIERERHLERARAADRERSKLLRHFSPAVAEAIVTHDGVDGDPLGASIRDDVTVLFADIRGFTELTERLPVLELADLLRGYFEEMTRAVFEEKGTLDKFIGDGLMAVFGAPVPDADGAARAIRCASRMLERLEVVNRRLPADRQLRIRIGVNTGRVAAGTFGSPERMEYTVLGDAVNVASRLESAAEPGTVYVGRSTYEQTCAAFDYRELGPRSVKGRAAPVDVFRLEGPRVR